MILPNNKEKQAHSSHRGTKKSTCAAFALANFLQKANSGSSWRLSSEQVGGTECSFVYHVPGPRGISPGYFLPQQGIVPSIDQLPRWGSRVLTVSFPSPAQPLNL